MLIEISNLRYKYPGEIKWALNEVSFSADRGEFILLAGPSGCGKSTLARVLNGLIPNFYGGELHGNISVCGLDPRKHPTYEFAKNVGFVFQNPENQLFFNTVERELAFGLENLGLPRDEMMRRVERALKEYRLLELRERSPFELSGGQQQRVAIASVMVMNPRVLILDEPTANLDPLTALHILALVRRKVAEEGVLAIVIEHRLEIALPFATRMVVMWDGKIVDDGSPRAVISRQGHVTGFTPALKLLELLEEGGVVLSPDGISPERIALEIVRAYRGKTYGKKWGCSY